MRVVSLCPSLTESVFALGRGECLVGRSRYCICPEDEVDGIEDVGGTKDPDVERIIELAPDLVLLNEEENRIEDHDALVEAGIECWSSFPKDPADVPAVLRELGRRIGADASRFAEEIEGQLAACPEPERRPTFVYLCWRQPWMAAARDTFASRLLEAAGGRCVVTGSERYPVLEPSELRELDPDFVLLSSEPFPFEAEHAQELARSTGIPVERFLLCDGRELSWHGTRTVSGLPYAGRLLGL